MKCRLCGTDIPVGRLSYRRTIFCSAICRRQHEKQQYAKANPSSHLTTTTVGTLSELKVSIDLLQKGYEVFRAVSSSCSCDLALLKDGKLLRVEVTTGHFSPRNRIPYFPLRKQNNGKFDILAIVTLGEIVYKPSLELAVPT